MLHSNVYYSNPRQLPVVELSHESAIVICDSFSRKGVVHLII